MIEPSTEDGYNVITLARGERQAQRVVVNNPPAGGIDDWAGDLRIQAWDDVNEDPVIDATTGFTIVDSADTFEWLPTAANTSSLTPKVYSFKISLVTTGAQIAFGPLIVRP
jgi:hypothetical protein